MYTCSQTHTYTRTHTHTHAQVMHRDHPQLRFSALALAFAACPTENDWWSHFLDPSKHAPAVRDSMAKGDTTYLSWVGE